MRDLVAALSQIAYRHAPAMSRERYRRHVASEPAVQDGDRCIECDHAFPCRTATLAAVGARSPLREPSGMLRDERTDTT